MCHGTEHAVYLRILLIEACGPGGGQAAGDASVKTSRGLCRRAEAYGAERFARGSPAWYGYIRAGAHLWTWRDTGSWSFPLLPFGRVHFSDRGSASRASSIASLYHHALGGVLRKPVNSVQSCAWGSRQFWVVPLRLAEEPDPACAFWDPLQIAGVSLRVSPPSL